jgi:hypothetical protein
MVIRIAMKVTEAMNCAPRITPVSRFQHMNGISLKLHLRWRSDCHAINRFLPKR